MADKKLDKTTLTIIVIAIFVIAIAIFIWFSQKKEDRDYVPGNHERPELEGPPGEGVDIINRGTYDFMVVKPAGPGLAQYNYYDQLNHRNAGISPAINRDYVFGIMNNIWDIGMINNLQYENAIIQLENMGAYTG